MIWIPYLAQEYLKQILHPSMEVFEYGCGDSTIFFSQLVNNVVSVEHNKEWYDKINKVKPINVELIYCPMEQEQIGDDRANPNHYKSNSIDGSFKNYVIQLQYHGVFADLVFIDGRARASCLRLAFAYKFQWIVLDNTERDFYTQNIQIPDNYEIIKIFGYGPRNTWPWETTFFKRREK